MSERWREPTALLPLRWGSYRARYLTATALVIAGALLVQATSVYAVFLLGAGFLAMIAGWLVLPSRGLRRLGVVIPAALASSAPLFGSAGAIALVVALAAWLYLRQRPGIAYLVLPLPVLSGVILAQLFPQYGDGLIVVAVSLVVVVASAWLAQSIARTRPAKTRPIPSKDRPLA